MKFVFVKQDDSDVLISCRHQYKPVNTKHLFLLRLKLFFALFVIKKLGYMHMYRRLRWTPFVNCCTKVMLIFNIGLTYTVRSTKLSYWGVPYFSNSLEFVLFSLHFAIICARLRSEFISIFASLRSCIDLPTSHLRP